MDYFSKFLRSNRQPLQKVAYDHTLEFNKSWSLIKVSVGHERLFKLVIPAVLEYPLVSRRTSARERHPVNRCTHPSEVLGRLSCMGVRSYGGRVRTDDACPVPMTF